MVTYLNMYSSMGIQAPVHLNQALFSTLAIPQQVKSMQGTYSSLHNINPPNSTKNSTGKWVAWD